MTSMGTFDDWLTMGLPGGKRDGVMGHFSGRENVILIKIWRENVIGTLGENVKPALFLAL